MLALAMGLLLAAPPALHLRLSAGAGLSHGLLGPAVELRLGHFGVFGAIGFPHYAYGKFEGLGGIFPAGGIRYRTTPDEPFSWFFSAQIARFTSNMDYVPGVCCETFEENRTTSSLTLGADARAGPIIFSFALGPAFTWYRRKQTQGGIYSQEQLGSTLGLGTDLFIPDFELAVGTEF
jgi:hypothetical protein